MKKILITGPLGQDGIILTELLQDKYELHGVCRMTYSVKKLNDHKKNYKAYLNGTYQFVTSFKILELGDAYIELLEEINCDNKNQLEKREGELIREHKNNCVNRCIAGRTKQEYYIDNKDISFAIRLILNQKEPLK